MITRKGEVLEIQDKAESKDNGVASNKDNFFLIFKFILLSYNTTEVLPPLAPLLPVSHPYLSPPPYSLPLPGSQGISEIMYAFVFSSVFTNFLIPSMCVTRGLSFYFLLLIGGCVTVFYRLKISYNHKR